MSTRHGAGRFLSTVPVLFLVAAFAAPVSAAITVAFEQIAHTGDPVPGREALNVVFNGRAFQQTAFTDGVLSRPSINAAGEVVFRGVSTHPSNFNLNGAIGLYAKSPGFPLSVLVDTTTAAGVPVFAVPGQPATTQFTNFKPPFVNDRGDVLFYATYGGPTGGGSGFYAMTTTGGPIVKIVDSSDTVPAFPGTVFSGFAFGGSFGRFTFGSLNDVGQVVIMGIFNAPDDPFIDVGLYGSTVAGGPLTRLADATGSISVIDQPGITIHGLQQDRNAALNNAGMVVFGADVGPTPFTAKRAVLAVPVDGSTGVRTLGKRFDPVVLSDGVTHTLLGNFNGHDITDAGQFMFQHTFSSGAGAINALITGDINVPGSPLSVVVDNAGGFAVPQRTGTNFTGIRMTALNDSGQLGFDALTDIPANSSGIYSTDLSGGPVGFVSDSLTAPPGRPGIVFSSFGSFDIPNDGESVAINNSGNMALIATAVNETATDSLFGVYFFDSCTGNLERLVDDTTSSALPPVGLGGTFVAPGCSGFPCQRLFMMWDGSNTRAGHYRSMNDNNDVAFITAFSTFDVGLYVAHVTAGAGGGGVTITCPADVVVECGGLTDPGVTGTATAVGGCSGASIPTTFSDVVVPGVGGTETIARTWTADDGAGNVATCNQIVSVADSVVPTLAGVPANTSVESNAIPAPANPTVSDTCDPAVTLTFVETRVDGACANQFTLTRTWTATDASNNVTTQSQTISVVDTTPPSLVGVPADVSVECDAIPAPANVTAIDNGTAATVSFSEVQTGACLSSATLTRTWTSVDACGNTGSATQVITVQDTTPPVATAGLTLLSGGDVEGSGDHDDDEGIFAVTALCSDNCDAAAGCAATTVSAVLTCVNGVSVAVTPGQFAEIEDEDEGGCEVEIENGRLEVEGRVTLTVTCTDAAGNMSSATALPVGLAPDNDSELDFDD